jgi:hypothetical protein
MLSATPHDVIFNVGRMVNTDHPGAVNQARSDLAPAGAIVKPGPEDDDRRSGPLVVCADIDTVTRRRDDTESLLSRHVLQPLVRGGGRPLPDLPVVHVTAGYR